MFAICVNRKHMKTSCSGGRIWVDVSRPDDYVYKYERSLFKSKDEAMKHISSHYEVVVNVDNESLTPDTNKRSNDAQRMQQPMRKRRAVHNKPQWKVHKLLA